MRKFLFFHLWKLEKLEEYLEIMEKNGYRLDSVKHSYWFCFKESNSKEMHYFLSYKSFVKPSMGMVDYALLSRHNANIVKTKMCFFELSTQAQINAHGSLV